MLQVNGKSQIIKNNILIRFHRLHCYAITLLCSKIKSYLEEFKSIEELHFFAKKQNISVGGK